MFKTPLYTYDTAFACENPYVSIKAAELLNKGVNAADLAVFISLGLAVSIPHLGGIGGDFFSIIYDRDDGSVRVVMGSGYSGKFSSIDNYMNHGFKSMPRYGGAAVTIPGLVDGLRVLWREFGSVEWGELVNPVIDLCYDGFPLSRTLLNGVRHAVSSGAPSRTFKSVYGELNNLHVGDRVRFKGLGRLLELIREDPRDFYEGDPAENFVSVLNEEFEIFSLEDFKDYRAYVTEPLRIRYKGFDIYEMPLNSLGIATLQLLRLNEAIGEEPPPLSPSRIQYYLRLFKPVYIARERFLGDPKYLKISVDKLLDVDFLMGLDGGSRRAFDGDTTFFCVADEKFVIGCIQSLFYPFGSRVVDSKYQVVFNNRGYSFTFDESCVNYLAPNKYPLHTLSAPLLKSEDVVYVLGLSAGIFRPQLHLQLVTNLIDYEMYPQEAIEYPRFTWDPETGLVRFEDRYGDVSDLGFRTYAVSYGSRLGVGSILRVADNIISVYPDIRGEVFPGGR